MYYVGVISKDRKDHLFNFENVRDVFSADGQFFIEYQNGDRLEITKEGYISICDILSSYSVEG